MRIGRTDLYRHSAGHPALTNRSRFGGKMEDLLQWLRREKGGAATYAQFREKALALRHREPEHAALLRILAEIAGRFADAYDEERLPLELSKAVLAHLT
jgi:hypothetical protein